MRTIKWIVIHCTATPQTTTIDSIKNYWKNVLKWKSVGYHHIIQADGSVVKLEDYDNPTNGVAGYNKNSVHISYIGGVDSNNKPVDNRTAAQKQSMETLVKTLAKAFPDAKIQGHRDFPKVNKACPSFDVKTWLKQIGL
jgi:N-acetylmuramoyl-L-alanine amidase